MSRFVVAAIFSVCVLQTRITSALLGADPPAPEKLNLHAAAAPTPALKYRLLPSAADRLPGNAAAEYGKVMAEQWTYFNKYVIGDELEKWREMPLAQLRGEDVPLPGNSIYFLERGAKCRYCDWQLPIGDVPFYTILLPEAQQSRMYSRVLAVKARRDIAKSDFDEAIKTFQTNYALARNIAEGETFVNGLIGIAMCGIMYPQVLEFIQQPGAPNLYWALSALPTPLVDMNDALEVESKGLELSFSQLKDVESAQRTPEQWRDVFHGFAIEALKLMSTADRPAPRPSREELDKVCEQMLPAARRALIDAGMPAETIDSMPLHQVALLYTRAAYHRLFDDAAKYFSLPYPDAIVGIEKSIAEAESADADMREIVPLARQTLGAVRGTRMAIERNDRQIATLRVIEALRMYGANHDGELPELLTDVTEVPIPDDPVTGLPFEYELTEGKARLSGPTFRDVALNYEITMAAGAEKSARAVSSDSKQPPSVATLKTREGFYVRAVKGGGDDVVADAREPRTSEQFTFEWLDGNQRVRIRTREGFYLHPEQGGGGDLDAEIREPRTSEVFDVDWPDKNFSRLRLKTREGFYVRAVQGGGGDVVADVKEPGTSEVFTLMPVAD
jgi:hypothetical protein